MTIIRRTNNWLPSVFNDFFGNEWMEQGNKSAPAINIQQNENGFTVEVAAPGMTKEDCNVRIDDSNNLVIAFEKKNQTEDKDKKGSYLRREFSYTQFQRRMILPDHVEKDKITAKVENGVLTVDIPTVSEEKTPTTRLIEIQ
ncbi:MAG: Hsp20/alpha crystallin family protein [Proteiniphilum sp.]|jgi:HSP20 family protein|nr:Hsp20/alpha crystallin family protein [Porphyromonadaceae bacterium]MDD2314078.1 Hsp20/alpha crystallin family protein [Proteiniphilum sp.]NCB24150.1 Hsp20/alpha crystallin family protein [Bacteroidia bacterium]MDD2936815.1 Hsp20/alpha crystallin family protein [Proteiniphilum sp.]MDD3075422.1 Hsp20/alpha crystallin family protein [Proteiniphilum sp.]